MRLHNKLRWIARKRGVYHVRKRVPTLLVDAVGKGEIWRSLCTTSEAEAVRRSHAVLAVIEADLAEARLGIGQNVDPIVMARSQAHSLRPFETCGLRTLPNDSLMRPDQASVSELFAKFLSDPTQDWSSRTRLAYETTERLAVSILGASTPLSDLTRSKCREFIEILRFLPKGASRAFPKLSLKDASLHAKTTGYENIISASNANTYLNKVCVVLNWAVREELLARNHLRGLRLADPIARMEKRRPFSDEQLQLIFEAPLFTGCRDDESNYAKPGEERPRGSRFWIPIIALHSGMRLNEICQLDVSDVRAVDGTDCFAVSERSLIGTTDKRLKTSTSERLVPIHSFLKMLGLADLVRERAGAGHAKLFFDICPGQQGYRSTAFSKWFVLFLESADARMTRTSFHSFRHCFRDALRRARVDREIAMRLGGWGSGSKSGLDVSDYYGQGFESSILSSEIEKVTFEHIKSLHALKCLART